MRMLSLLVAIAYRLFSLGHSYTYHQASQALIRILPHTYFAIFHPYYPSVPSDLRTRRSRIPHRYLSPLLPPRIPHLIARLNVDPRLAFADSPIRRDPTLSQPADTYPDTHGTKFSATRWGVPPWECVGREIIALSEQNIWDFKDQ